MKKILFFLFLFLTNTSYTMKIQDHHGRSGKEEVDDDYETFKLQINKLNFEYYDNYEVAIGKHKAIAQYTLPFDKECRDAWFRLAFQCDVRFKPKFEALKKRIETEINDGFFKEELLKKISEQINKIDHDISFLNGYYSLTELEKKDNLSALDIMENIVTTYHKKVKSNEFTKEEEGKWRKYFHKFPVLYKLSKLEKEKPKEELQRRSAIAEKMNEINYHFWSPYLKEAVADVLKTNKETKKTKKRR